MDLTIQFSEFSRNWTVDIYRGVDFHFAIDKFRDWLEDVDEYERETKSIDPWDEIENGNKNNLLLNQSFSNAPFTQEEIKQIEPAIDVLKSKLKSADAQPEILVQLKLFATELKEIKEELKSLKKKSWIRQYSGWAIQLLSFVGKEWPEKIEEVQEWIKNFMEQFNRPLIS